jgi:DNA-binding XRE family transcriptional regulator
VGGDNLGTRIRRARERARLTQAQLAEQVGVDRKTIDNWENNRSRPRSRLAALEEVLGGHGFAGDGQDPQPAPAGSNADGVVRMVREILDSAFSPALQVQMIREVIEQEYRPEQAEHPPSRRQPTG